MCREILFVIFSSFLSVSTALGAEAIPNYEIQEDGTVYNKRTAILAARALLKDKDLGNRIEAAKVICEISHYEPNKVYDMSVGYNLLINSEDQEIYQMGIEAIKRFIVNMPLFMSNHLSIYFGNMFNIPSPEKGITKWLQLYKDLADDKNLSSDLREIFAGELRYLQKHRQIGLQHNFYDYLDMPLRELKKIIDQQSEQANALADKIMSDPA